MVGERRYTSLGAKRADLGISWSDRLDDASALLAAGRHAAAMAMILYALEIRLKERVCSRLELEHLPRPFEIHDLDELLVLAGLSKRLKRRDRQTSRVRKNWDAVLKFAKRSLNELRYRPDAAWTQGEAEALMSWVNDPSDGILPWISRQI